MTVGAHHRCEVGEHVRLGTTDAHEGRQRLERSCTLGARGAHAIELPRALRGARRPDRRHRVSQPAIGKQRRVAQVRGSGEHVELQPDRRTGSETQADKCRLEPAQARQRLDVVERALRAGTFEIAPDEQQRVARDGDDQVRVLAVPARW